jgi:hypothetical protein
MVWGTKMPDSLRENNYLIFSDESGTAGNERYHAIGTVSGSLQDMRTLHKQLGDMLEKHKKSDVKFKKLNGDSTYTKISKEFISLGLEKCHEGIIRINVMVWDTQDRRHSIQGRDDTENFKRMYYHALKVTMKQWNNQLKWEFYPDEHTAINWQEIADYLSRTNLSRDNKVEQTLFGDLINLDFAKIYPPTDSSSPKYHNIQLADLFAGIVRTSHLYGQDLIEWRLVNGSGELLPTVANQDHGLSKGQKAKFEIMSHFKDRAGHHRLGVNLSKNKYFQTFNKNILLWKYEPQNHLDKAPVKQKG